jgi:hypothetical protein
VTGVRLDCPICGATVSDGPPPEPGECPNCGARYLGDADAVPQVAEALLTAAGAGVGDVQAGVLARRLFEIDPDSDLAREVAVTSDRRDGFYRWWVFVRRGLDPREAVRLVLEAPAE